MTVPPDLDAQQRAAVLRVFVDERGRLRQMPAKHTKRLVVLDAVAQRFDPGTRYPEREVDAVLRQVWDDHAALRRYLVDAGFLSREGGVYWRTGGTVDQDDGTVDPDEPGEEHSSRGG